MNKYFIISILICLLVNLQLKAQTDSTQIELLKKDTARLEINEQLGTKIVKLKQVDSLKNFKPDPTKVVWMAAVIPGYGQILNRKYWKLPIVYGGFLGCAYFITWNSSLYQTYKNAYRDIIDTDPNTDSYLETLPEGYTIDLIGGITTYTNNLKTRQDNYRRYRDLSVIFSLGYYALTIVDAFVDAQLYDFDISPDLSMKLQPVLLKNNYNSIGTLGVQCRFNLK